MTINHDVVIYSYLERLNDKVFKFPVSSYFEITTSCFQGPPSNKGFTLKRLN